MTIHHGGAALLGLTLVLGLPCATAAAQAGSATPTSDTGLRLEGFVGFPANAEAKAEEGTTAGVEVSSDLAAASGPTLSADADALGRWDRTTVLAAVVAGFGLTGALALRTRAPQLGQWLNRKGLEIPREQVSIIAVKPLGNNTSLAVVEVFDERLVLAVSAGQISLLTRVERPAAPAYQAPPRAPTFGKMLDRALDTDLPELPLEDGTRELAPPSPPPRAAMAAAPVATAANESLSSVLREALSRRHPRAEAPVADPTPARAPAAEPRRPAGATTATAPTTAREPNPWARPQERASRAALAAAAARAPEGAADQVLRKISTMRRFR